MRRSFLVVILLFQIFLSSFLLLFVKLSSIGFVGNTYFWFFVPVMLVLYIMAIFLSMKDGDPKIGIISSIVFFACLKFAFALIWADGINKTLYSYFYHRSVDSVLNFGYIDLEEISEIFISFAEHPPIILVLSVIESVTGLKFDLIYSYVMSLIAPLIIMPLIYGFLRRTLGLQKSEALLGLLLYNSNFLNFGSFPFGYAQYGFLLFLLSLHFLGEKNKSSRAVFLILCLVNSMTYSISAYMLIIFVAILYILQRLNFLPNTAKINSSDVLFPVITTVTWTIYRATSDLATIRNIAVLFLGHLTLPELTHQTISQGVSDPYADLIYFMYVGQGLFLLLGLFGLITILFRFRDKKSYDSYILLWLIAGIILAFFAFGVSWLHLPALIGDYRFRFVIYFMLFVIPLTAFGFQKLESTLSQGSNRKTSFAVMGIITFMIVFSPIANNASPILRTKPIIANETIAAPYQWVHLSHFVSSYAPKDIIFLGGGRAQFLWSMGAIPPYSLSIERNPYVVISEFSGPYFLAFSKYNLYLPDDAWPDEPIVTTRQLELINLRCNKYFDSGDVWLYYFESTK